MNFLTFQTFKENAERNIKYDESGQPRGHWKARDIESRWEYHAQAIDVVRRSGCTDSHKVLELGTMGAQIVDGSHTMDFDERWTFDRFNPTYYHDARIMPWPIADKQYEWFVALRVFHHLWPVQEECFREALRIAHNVLIVAPSSVSSLERNKMPRTDAGVMPLQVLKWNYGVPPREWNRTGKHGDLYWCSSADQPTTLNKAGFVAKAGLYGAIAAVRDPLRRNLGSIRRRLIS